MPRGLEWVLCCFSARSRVVAVVFVCSALVVSTVLLRLVSLLEGDGASLLPVSRAWTRARALNRLIWVAVCVARLVPSPCTPGGCGLRWDGLHCAALCWIGLDWIVLHCTVLDGRARWNGLDWMDVRAVWRMEEDRGWLAGRCCCQGLPGGMEALCAREARARALCAVEHAE